MALRMMLGRNLLQKAAPATTRFFRAAAVSMKIPATEAELDAYLAQPGMEGMTSSQIVAKILAENPEPPPTSSEPDILKEVYYKQQRNFRALFEKIKEIEIPFNGDDAAIAAYAEKRKAILKEVRVWQ